MPKNINQRHLPVYGQGLLTFLLYKKRHLPCAEVAIGVVALSNMAWRRQKTMCH